MADQPIRPQRQRVTWPRLQVTSWLPQVRTSWRIDLVAGMTLWGLAVPQAIAYAGLAGLGPAAGIWAVILILPVYALWGTSRHLVSTPLSSAAVTMASLIAIFAPGTDPARAAATISLTVGAVFLLAYLFRLGFLVNFISAPILAGFTFGLSVQIVVSQANKLFGVPGGDGHVVDRVIALVSHLGQTNWVTVAVAVVGFAIMIALPRTNPRIPAGLIMIAVTTLVVSLFALDSRFGVETPGSIETGLPALVAPTMAGIEPAALVGGSIGIVLLALSEASSVGREVADEKGYTYSLDADLFPWGVGNAASAMVGGVVGAGSMSTTLANVAAGARTQLATVVTAVLGW